MFRRAGIKRNTPPKFMSGCTIEDTMDEENAPLIISPIADTRIVITSEKDFEPIGFMAFGNSMDSKLIWFLDDTTLGTTKSGETLKYNVPMGDHTVRVTDTTGPTTEIKFGIIH